MLQIQYYAKLPASGGIQYAPSSITKPVGGGSSGHYASSAYRTPYLTHYPVAPHPEPKQQYQYASHSPFTYYQPTTQQHNQHPQQQQYAIIPAVTDAYQHPYYPHHRFALQAAQPAVAPPPPPQPPNHQFVYALAPSYNTQQHGIQLALIAPMTIQPGDGKLGGGIQYATSPLSTSSPTTTTSAATTTSTQKSVLPTYTHLTLIPSMAAASSKPDGSTAATNLIFSAGPQLYQAQNGAFYGEFLFLFLFWLERE